MALPPENAAPAEAADAARPELRLIEASDARDRTCADCGKRTTAWKPIRRKGSAVILCLECAAKPPRDESAAVCPSCGAPLEVGDTFCGKCGARIEYECPTCGAVMEATDTFCGKCGTRVA